MATLPDASEPRAASTSTSVRLVEYEAFIESQLRKTRSHVRGVDLAAHLLTFVAGMLGYLLLAGLVDHWVVSGGLGFWGRLLFLAGGLALAGYLLARTLPLLIKRINPLYAAQTIERSRPALKNGLLNFLFFRENPAGLSPVVYQAIEEQAATNLAHGHEDVAVDRTQLIRVGYVLVGILLVCAVYTLFSPKDLFRTAGRVIMPWAEIEPPTRTIISAIEPGNVQAFRGDRVTVKAHIENLKEGEPVTLYYSTADAQTVDRAVEMRLPPDGYKFECVVPAGEASLQQSLVYRIKAGDAVSPDHRLDVTDAPTILVRSVEYKYPAYTGLRSQRVENQGDLKAIEGTEITLHAQANEAIESAHVDFNSDDQLDRRMIAEENLAHASFFLALQPDRITPTHKDYRLIFKNAQGQRNPQPVKHEIEVTRDLAPEIQFVSPKPVDVELPLDGTVELEVVANDPDFALRSIKLLAMAAGQPLVDKLLLDEVWRGQAVKKFTFAPRKLGLKAGDVVDYLAIAEDNKDPQPNRTETAARRIRIVSPAGKSGDERLAKRDPNAKGSADEPGANEPGGGQDEHPRDAQPAADAKPDDSGAPADDRNADAQPAGEEGATEPQPDTKGEQAAEAGEATPSDGAEQAAGGDAEGESGAGQEGQNGETAAPSDGTNDGEAFDRILKKLNERDPKQQDPPQDDAGEKNSDQQPGKSSSGAGKSEKPSADGKSSPSKSPDGKQPDSEQPDQAGDKPEKESEAGADKPSPDQKGQKGQKGEQQRPEQEPGEKPQDGQPGEPKQSDPKQGGDKGDQEKAGGEKGSKEQGGGEKGAGEKQPGEQGQGEQSGDQGDAGQKGQGAGKQGAKSGAAGQDGQEGADENASPDSQPGAKGKGKPTDDAAGDDAEASAEPAEGNSGGKQGKGKAANKPADGKTPPQAEPGAGNEAGEKGGQFADPAGAKPADKPQGKGEQTPGKSDPSGDEPGDESGAEKAEKSGDGEKPRGDDARESLTPDGKPANDAEGQGAKSQDDPLAKPDKQAPRDKESSNSQGGDAEKNKGNSGAGQRGQESKGSPSPDQPNQPREKRPAQSKEDQEEKPNDEAQSPSNSQRESDSEGQDSGDRSGGGKQGGGQKANKAGTGGAGQNTAADEGAGKSQEAGQGEDSDRAGTDGESDKPTGQQGSKQGPGSKTRPGGEKGEGQPTEKSSPDGQPGAPADEPNSDQAGTPGGAQSGASPTDGQANSKQTYEQWKARQDQAEKANLEYAQKATDLALRHLKEELAKNQGDPPLLKELGWSREETQRFIDRWEQMRARSGMSGPSGKAAQRELDDTLRSLGLRARATTLQGNQARGNKVQGYKESRRATPPPEFAEEYKAYTEGTARGGK